MELLRTRLAWLSAAIVLVLAACSGSGGGDTEERGGATSTTESLAAGGPGDTADSTPVEIDAAIRTGVLDYGLTYYVRSNDAPGSQLQLRLVIRAGSVQEIEERSGLAHFTEHMMFNGTEAYPRNDLNEVLRGFGSEFGPDLNAYTSHDETVYILSIPQVDDDVVEEAFDILDEWAERALVTEQDTVEERGVVREEFRARAESVDGVIFDSFERLYSANSSYENRPPIGSEESILATTAAGVREFYDRWYRPELMAVVAVGDVSADRLEAEIRDRFSDNESRGDGVPWEPPTAPPITEAHVEVLVHPDGPDPFVSLDYSIPTREGGTVGGERLLLRDEVVAALIQQRLDDGSARGTLPVVRPSAGNFSHTRGRRFLGFNFVAEDEAAGLEAVIADLRALEVHGFGEAELSRVIDRFGAAVDQMLDSADSRQDAEFADSYVEHFLGGFAIDSVEDAHARYVAELAMLTPEIVSDHYRGMMAESAPLVIVVGADTDPLPTEDELWQAIEAGQTATVTADADASDVELPEPPEAVDEVELLRHEDRDAVELRFANGVRLLFSHSEIAAGRVDLLAAGEGGWSLLEPGDGPIAAVASHAVSLSGVADLDSVDLDRALAGSVVSVSPYIDETAEGFAGNSAAEDVELLLQLLHLLVTEPRVDPGPFAEAVEAAHNQVRSARTSPEFGSFLELLDARYGGDPWQQLLPTETQLDELTAPAALSLYRSRLGQVDDLVVALVGDVDEDLVLDLARRYLGSLPAGPADTWVDRSPPPPSGVTTREVGAGTNDSGAGFDLLITTDVELDETQRLAVPVLESIVNDLLVEQVREALGASYSGGRVFIEVADEPDQLVELVLSVGGDPERVDEMHQLVLGILDELATDGPTAADFDSARTVVQSDLEFIDNPSLLDELLAFARSGDDATTLADDYFGTLRLTIDDVAELAALVIDVDHRIEVFRRP